MDYWVNLGGGWLLSRSGGEKGLRGSGAGTLGGKIRSNLGERDSLSGQSEQGGVIGGRLLEN